MKISLQQDEIGGTDSFFKMPTIVSESSTSTATAPSVPALDTTVGANDEESGGLIRILGLGSSSSQPFGVDVEEATTTTTSLPRLLRMFYILNGTIISLLTLPLMYIVNTRVPVPVPYLPAYGAVAYLPYSFKPIYAYLSSCHSINIPLPFIRSNVNLHVALPPRHYIFIGLLTISSATIFMFTIIPSGGVVPIFVLSFLRGISDSWSELCLGLTLIDVGRFAADDNEHGVDNVENDQTYDKIVSRLQAEAATARNVGSLLAGAMTFLVFLQRYLTVSTNDHNTTEQLSGGVANALIIFTGILQFTGACLAYLYRHHLEQTETRRSPIADFSLLHNDQTDDNMEMETVNVIENHQGTENEEDRLMDDNRSHPSYSSSEDDELGEHRNANTSVGNSNSIDEGRGRQSSSCANLLAIVMLQLIVIAIAMKDPIVGLTSYFAWKVLIILLCLSLALTAIGLCCNNSWQFSHRVGLFLILRNAVPSETMVFWSFFYTLFQSQPLLLQAFSVLSLAVLMVSSWSYSKLWSRFSRGRPLLALIGGLVILSSLASLANVALFRKYQQLASTGESNIIKSVFGIALLATVATTFFSEWAFLPEVVLASVSIDQSGKKDSTAEANALSVRDINIPQSWHPVDSTNDDIPGSSPSSSNTRIAVEYGSLIACIDFGDQLGALAAAPLVELLGISRENGFLHMDRLLLICALSNVVVTLGLLPLLWKRRVD